MSSAEQEPASLPFTSGAVPATCSWQDPVSECMPVVSIQGVAVVESAISVHLAAFVPGSFLLLVGVKLFYFLQWPLASSHVHVLSQGSIPEFSSKEGSWSL